MRSIVEERCPELRRCVDGWLASYRDPLLLYDSLVREYRPSLVRPADAQLVSLGTGQPPTKSTRLAATPPDDSSSDIEMLPASEAAAVGLASSASSSAALTAGGTAGGPAEGYAEGGAASDAAAEHGGHAARTRLYKVRLCEGHLLGACRRGGDCTFAHGDDELAYWQSVRRANVDVPSPPSAMPAPAAARRLAVRPRLEVSGGSFFETMPSNIGFCHDSIAPAFRDGRAILATLLELVSGSLSLRDMPMMQVVLHEDRFYSVSNRRLCLYRLCEYLGMLSADTPVKVQLLETLPRDFARKFTTPCHGEWARVRRDGRICARTFDETSFGRELLR